MQATIPGIAPPRSSAACPSGAVQASEASQIGKSVCGLRQWHSTSQLHCRLDPWVGVQSGFEYADEGFGEWTHIATGHNVEPKVGESAA